MEGEERQTQDEPVLEDLAPSVDESEDVKGGLLPYIEQDSIYKKKGQLDSPGQVFGDGSVRN